MASPRIHSGGVHPNLPEQVTLLPVSDLKTTFSLRQGAPSDSHVEYLSKVINDVPPILVHSDSMEVVDGVHRVLATRAAGRSRIRARFVAGDEVATLVAGIVSNTRHGLPLSRLERRASALRIVALNPRLSDRWIAEIVGLSPSTIAELRRSSTARDDRLNTTLPAPAPVRRAGKDGRVRPLSAAAGKQLAAELFRQDPARTIRDVAHLAGISVGTAHAVKNAVGTSAGEAESHDRPPQPPDPASKMLSQLLSRMAKDPSVAHTEAGRQALMRLRALALDDGAIRDLLRAVPQHYRHEVSHLMRAVLDVWAGAVAELAEPA